MLSASLSNASKPVHVPLLATTGTAAGWKIWTLLLWATTDVALHVSASSTTGLPSDSLDVRSSFTSLLSWSHVLRWQCQAWPPVLDSMMMVLLQRSESTCGLVFSRTSSLESCYSLCQRNEVHVNVSTFMLSPAMEALELSFYLCRRILMFPFKECVQ